MIVQGIRESDKKFFNTRRRTILYLIENFLKETGYPDIASTLKNEALLNDYEICDNIDIDTIFLEYCSYQQLKFGKIPNILKKIISPVESRTNLPNENFKRKKSEKNLQQKSTSEVYRFPLPMEDTLSDTISIKQVESYKAIENCNNKAAIALNLEFSSDWKEYSELITRTLISKESKYSFTDVIGNTEAITTLKEAVMLPIENPTLFVNDFKPWKSVLLYGPPGCGKTLIAKALSSEIQQNSIQFFNITSSTLISKWRGDSEKILNALFQIARAHAPSILFFDEIECLTSRRNSANEHEASHRLKSEFLTLLDGLQSDSDADHIFTLANTNVPWSIDEAFLRRFEKKILIKLPTPDERIQILNYCLEDSKKWSDLSIEEIKKSSEGFTGDEIRIACKEAKMKCIRKILNKGRNIKPKVILEKDVKVDSNSLTETIKLMKPNSVKSYEKHVEWQKQIGSSDEKN